MTGYERIDAAMRGKRPDRVPIMLHNFMMAAHAKSNFLSVISYQ